MIPIPKQKKMKETNTNKNINYEIGQKTQSGTKCKSYNSAIIIYARFVCDFRCFCCNALQLEREHRKMLFSRTFLLLFPRRS